MLADEPARQQVSPASAHLQCPAAPLASSAAAIARAACGRAGQMRTVSGRRRARGGGQRAPPPPPPCHHHAPLAAFLLAAAPAADRSGSRPPALTLPERHRRSPPGCPRCRRCSTPSRSATPAARSRQSRVRRDRPECLRSWRRPNCSPPGPAAPPRGGDHKCKCTRVAGAPQQLGLTCAASRAGGGAGRPAASASFGLYLQGACRQRVGLVERTAPTGFALQQPSCSAKQLSRRRVRRSLPPPC